MSDHTHLISATEVSRTLSHVLNTVLYHGDSYEITRGKEVIARLIPAKQQGKTMTTKKFQELLKNLPPLDSEDARHFEASIKELRKKMPKVRNPWE